MDPVSAIVSALTAGAAASAEGVASDAVKTLYAGLKKILSGKLTSLSNLEEEPADEDYRRAVQKEISRKGLADEPEVLDQVGKLTQALEQEKPDRLLAWGVDISEIRAAGSIVINKLEAKLGNVRVRGIESSGGNIEITDIKSSAPGKN
jgi:hypothetical protein